jgi:hypothetical protein
MWAWHDQEAGVTEGRSDGQRNTNEKKKADFEALTMSTLSIDP